MSVKFLLSKRFQGEKMLVSRPYYENQIMNYFETPFIKVLTGVRRCGKSTLLQMIAKRASQNGTEKDNIILLRMDEYGIPLQPTADWLANYLDEKLQSANPNQMAYIFLDEIQDIPGWERVVRQLQTRSNTDVYLTGSNAYMLSTELSTLLAGRFIEIKINPLSFGEYLSFRHKYGLGIGETKNSFEDKSLNGVFLEYLKYGGMPGQFDLAERNDETIITFLKGIFDSIMLNDVAKRTRISDIDLLEKLAAYLFKTSGSLFSTKKIVNTLQSIGRKTSQRTIDDYLKALKNALIVREVPQFGLKGKEILNPKRKFYAVDTGLRNFAAGFPVEDIGYQLENVVCNELVKRGYEIFVGSLPNGSEVDFIARKPTGEQRYYQVTQSLTNDDVYKRELAPLQQITDSFPKTVITFDELRTGITKEGIQIVSLNDWLLETLNEDVYR